MAYFQWGEDLTTGSDAIDHDHRKLIELVNDLHTATQQGQGRAVVGKVLDDLISYAKDHFRQEELHMEKILYPEIDAHKRQHSEIMAKVLTLKVQYEGGKVTVAAKVSALLREWLSIHIMHFDKAFAGFMSKNSAKSGLIEFGSESKLRETPVKQRKHTRDR